MTIAPPPQRPIVHAEQALTTAFLDGTFPPGATLPAERELAPQLGVTRPTLREALRRLERDGWVRIQQGKPTHVTDFWREGGLNVLGALIRFGSRLPPNFIPNLLEARQVLAPAYTRSAVERAPGQIVELLEGHVALADEPDAYAAFDWQLHHALTVASGNPVYTLILNGFAGIYQRVAGFYFAQSEARHASQSYYAALLAMTRRGNAGRAERLTQAMMHQSIELWYRAGVPPQGGEL
jgi:GntR family transcriptional regulator, negative regulator for fad regulon and positive regulator of fabA